MNARTSPFDVLLFLLATAAFAVFVLRQTTLLALEDWDRRRVRRSTGELKRGREAADAFTASSGV